MGSLEEFRKKFAEAAGIPDEEQKILDAGSSHSYLCRCEDCRKWWKLMGPDGGEPGHYGPFTEEEVGR